MPFADETSERVNPANQCHPAIRARESATWMNEWASLNLKWNEKGLGRSNSSHVPRDPAVMLAEQSAFVCAERGGCSSLFTGFLLGKSIYPEFPAANSDTDFRCLYLSAIILICGWTQCRLKGADEREQGTTWALNGKHGCWFTYGLRQSIFWIEDKNSTDWLNVCVWTKICKLE